MYNLFSAHTMVQKRGETMSGIAQDLGERIRQLRNQREMSQEELAFKAGISAAHLGQIERALKSPTIETIGKISGALNVPLTMLFSDEYEPLELESITINKINAQLLTMSAEDQKDILRIIRIFKKHKSRSEL